MNSGQALSSSFDHSLAGNTVCLKTVEEACRCKAPTLPLKIRELEALIIYKTDSDQMKNKCQSSGIFVFIFLGQWKERSLPVPAA